MYRSESTIQHPTILQLTSLNFIFSFKSARFVNILRKGKHLHAFLINLKSMCNQIRNALVHLQKFTIGFLCLFLCPTDVLTKRTSRLTLSLLAGESTYLWLWLGLHSETRSWERPIAPCLPIATHAYLPTHYPTIYNTGSGWTLNCRHFAWWINSTSTIQSHTSFSHNSSTLFIFQDLFQDINLYFFSDQIQFFLLLVNAVKSDLDNWLILRNLYIQSVTREF